FISKRERTPLLPSQAIARKRRRDDAALGRRVRQGAQRFCRGRIAGKNDSSASSDSGMSARAPADGGPGAGTGSPSLSRRGEMPGLGVFVGPNLTPDPETGLGEWSEAQIVRALQTGKRPDGRELAPIMPWRAFANLTKSDAHAIAAYLKSLPAVSHRVPGPFGPDEE